MATFKDIAELSGVSYGTVSNVLNGRGNVSSEKIQRVYQAAEKLGYTFNRGAQMLRKGNSNLLAVIVPNISDKQYADFYISFCNYAESRGYRTTFYLHNGDPRREAMLAGEIRSTLAAGVATVSALSGDKNPYAQAGFKRGEVLYVEQRPFPGQDYVGFDYLRLGREMGEKARAYRQVVLLTERADSYVSQQMTAGFMEEMSKERSCHIQHFEKEGAVRSATLSLDILSSTPAPEAIFSSNFNHAQMVRSIHQCFFNGQKLSLYTVSPLFTLPENDFIKYELNYRLLGKESAKMLIDRISGKMGALPGPKILDNTGFRSWIPGPPPQGGSLTMMTLDSPTAMIVKDMARMYTSSTGVPVKVAIFPYDGIHEMLTNLNETTPFDIIRLDATWMSWFAPKIFEPLKNLDAEISQLQDGYLPVLLSRYGGFAGEVYALPETPSAQMLFYRRDLFENTAIQRLYKEQTHEVLRPPKTFAEYNRIARFFTRSVNAASPVKYGSTLTLGNTGVAATEYLTRFFALTRTLFDANDSILLTSAEGVRALEELVEVSSYAGPGYNIWWRDTARTFAQGDVSMTVLYSNYASEMTGKDSRIRGDIGFSMVPGNNPMFGGGSIGVCRFSQNKELAYHFIKWLCSEEVSTAMTLLGSVSPCRKTYENYQVIDTYPWLSMSQECFEKSDARRMPHQLASSFDERRFLGILGVQVINAINGTSSVREALENADRLYRENF